MLDALILLAEEDNDVIRRYQWLVKTYLLLAVKKIDSFSSLDLPGKRQELYYCYLACLRFIVYSASTTIPHQIFAFGHVIGSLKEAEDELAGEKSFKPAMSSFLTSQGFSTWVAKKINRHIHKFAYSKALNKLEQLDPSGLYNICTVLGKLVVSIYPTESLDSIS